MTDKPLSIEERVQRVAREILEEYDQIVRFVSNQRDRSVESDLRHNGKSLELVIEKSLRRHFGDLDAAPAESQRDIQELRLAGAASDHIWAMVDGYEPHCIGLRMDSGDSGVVYMTPEQAHDVIDNLNSILWQLLEIPHASEQSTRGFSNVSINGAKVGDPLCLDCGRDKSAIKHRESGGHPFIATERPLRVRREAREGLGMYLRPWRWAIRHKLPAAR